MLVLGLTGDIACGKSTVAALLAKRGAHLLDADLLVRELYADPAFARQVAALFNSDSIDAQPAAPAHEYSCAAKDDIRAPDPSHEAQSHEAQSHEAQSHEAQSHEAQSHEAQSHEAQSHEAQSHEAQAERQSASRLEAQPEAQAPFLALDGTIDRVALGRFVFGNANALKRLEDFVHPAVAALRDGKIKALQSSVAPPHAVVLEAVKLIESGQALACDLVWWIACNPEIQLQRLMRNRGLSEVEALARLARQPDREAKTVLLGDIRHTLIENNAGLAELERNVEREWLRALETQSRGLA